MRIKYLVSDSNCKYSMWNIKGAIGNQDVSRLEFTSRARYKNIFQGFKYAIKFLKFDEITLFRNLFAGPRSNWISQRSSVPEVPARGFLWNQLELMGGWFFKCCLLMLLHARVISYLIWSLFSCMQMIDGTKEESLRWNKEIIAIGNWKGTERSWEEHNTRL